MESRQQWLSRLKNELSNSPLVSNVAFGFILMGLEKLVEMEFECPCNPTWNGIFSSVFFIIPAVMATTLMLIIQGSRYDVRCRCISWCRKPVSLSFFVPAVVWVLLMFLDGQYFTCAMTDWKGRFVLVEKAAPLKWCQPVSENNVTTQELMLRSQQLFFTSQGIGIVILIGICLGLIGYLIRECCQQEVQMQDEDESDVAGQRMQSLRAPTDFLTGPCRMDPL